MIPSFALEAMRSRRVLLWVCADYELDVDADQASDERHRTEPTETDHGLLSVYWEAIWCEGIGGAVARAANERPVAGDATVKRRPVILAADPDRRGQLDTRDFLPIYLPNGLIDSDVLDDRYDAPTMRRESYKVASLRKLEDYPDRCLVVIGAGRQQELATLVAALAAFAPPSLTVLILWPSEDPTPELRTGSTSIEFYRGSIESLIAEMLRDGVPSADFAPRYSLRVGTASVSLDESDLGGVDRYFLPIWESALLPPDRLDRGAFEGFLRGEALAWDAYAAGVPFDRQYVADVDGKRDLVTVIRDALGEFETSPSDLRNQTITVPAEPGSGLTIALRSVAFQMARLGYPSLVMREEQVSFDSDALGAFLNRLQQIVRGVNPTHRERPVLLVFDAEHADIESTHRLAQKMVMLGRNVVVLRGERGTSGTTTRIAGRSMAAAPLMAIVSQHELTGVAQHFGSLARRFPEIGLEPPTEAEWTEYQSSQVIVGPHDNFVGESLFWVALYFFLSSRGESPEGFDDWILRAFAAIDSPRISAIVKRIAALSVFGLQTPLMPLLRSSGQRDSIDIEMVTDLANLDRNAGLIRWNTRPETLDDQFLFFRHPLVAARLLRRTDPSIAWFPIELTWPVLENLWGGRSADNWLAERFTFNVLRSNRNLSAAQTEAIIQTFQRIPSEISERNKTVLHHWARALYHLGLGKVDGDAGDGIALMQDAVRTLQKAIDQPDDPGPGEHPSHLYNTLGTICAELALRYQGQSLEAGYWEQTTKAFERAIAISAENFEALLAYAYRLVSRAERVAATDTRESADAASLALTYLQQAEDIGGNTRADDTFFETTRGRVWRLVDPASAQVHVESLIQAGHEAGYLLAAYSTLRGVSLNNPKPSDERALQGAITILKRHSDNNQTDAGWRVPFLLYRATCASTRGRFAFGDRLALLEGLERSDFVWSLRLLFDKAVLYFQAGRFADGDRQFRRIRRLISQGGIPSRRLSDFWRDSSDPTRAQPATVRIRRVDSEWRAYGAIQEMGGQEIMLRPRYFDIPPKTGDYRQCVVRFETSGPVAVPATFITSESM